MSSWNIKESSVTIGLVVFCLSLVSIVLIRQTDKLDSLQLAPLPVIKPELKAVPRELATLFEEDFSQLSLEDWKRKNRTGSTSYEVIEGAEGNAYLKAESDQSASYLIKKVQYDPKKYPYLSWKWRVDELAQNANMKRLSGSDAPARVYVAFSRGFGMWNARLVNYVWASSMDVGASFSSFFSPNSRIVVLQSGSEKKGKWIFEERNVLEDYKKLFGKEAPKVEGIAIMTDSDNTKSKAVAFYDDIVVSRFALKASE